MTPEPTPPANVLSVTRISANRARWTFDQVVNPSIPDVVNCLINGQPGTIDATNPDQFVATYVGTIAVTDPWSIPAAVPQLTNVAFPQSGAVA